MSDLVAHNVPRPGSSLYWALLTAGRQREPLAAWLRWWHEVSSIPYAVSDPSVAERKLVWWGQAVAEGFRDAPQHPLLRALLRPSAAHLADGCEAPPLPLWLEQIEGLRLLTQQTRWLNESDLDRHMNATTGAACEGAAWICGAREPAALECARAIGMGLRRTHILARIGQDARQGWLHVPIDLLQRHDVRAHELLKPASPTPTPAMSALFASWHDHARRDLVQALDKAKALSSENRLALRPLATAARQALALLDDLSQAGYIVLDQRLLVAPWRKAWIAQRTRWTWR